MDCQKKDENTKNSSILGVNISVINMEEIVEYIIKNYKKMKGKYICLSNVHTTTMSYEDPYYKNVQNNAIFCLPDGKPLSVILKKRGFSQAERVTGPDLMDRIFSSTKNLKISHYFYGSSNETLNKLKEQLNLKYHGLNIAGLFSPPFRTLSKTEDDKVVETINNSNADIIWVGLGAPKQEIWMYEHRNKINGLMIGVGAGFDYHAGNIKRAPLWMQTLSLEWLYRLIQDPKRLFKRYFVTNTKFIVSILKEK